MPPTKEPRVDESAAGQRTLTDLADTIWGPAIPAARSFEMSSPSLLSANAPFSRPRCCGCFAYQSTSPHSEVLLPHPVSPEDEQFPFRTSVAFRLQFAFARPSHIPGKAGAPLPPAGAAEKCSPPRRVVPRLDRFLARRCP